MFSYRIDDQLELRLLDRNDAAELFALVERNREHLRQWLPWVDRTRTIEDTCEFLAATRKQYADDDGFHAAIVADGAIVGVVGMHGIDRPNRATSFGYWLDHGHEGKGYMTRACRALVDHLIRDLGLHRIEVRCAPGNRPSRSVPERLGFTEEGTLRQSEWLYDRWVDGVVYSMLAPDWKDAG